MTWLSIEDRAKYKFVCLGGGDLLLGVIFIIELNCMKRMEVLVCGYFIY